MPAAEGRESERREREGSMVYGRRRGGGGLQQQRKEVSKRQINSAEFKQKLVKFMLYVGLSSRMRFNKARMHKTCLPDPITK